MFVIWIGAWIWFSGLYTQWTHDARSYGLAISKNLGLQVENIYVKGRRNLTRQAVLGAIGEQKGDALLAVDHQAIQKRLESISWVEKAQVQIRYPDSLYVIIKERLPLALWYYNGQISLIDNKGVVLTHDNLLQYGDYPVVTGKNAHKHAAFLLAVLKAEPWIYGRLKAAAFVSQRRWDLKLKNGLILHLPEQDMGLALSRLVKALKETGVLERNVISVDARHDDRLIIKTRPGAVHTRHDYKKSDETVIKDLTSSGNGSGI